MPQCGDVEGESQATHLFKQGFETGSPVDRKRKGGPLEKRAAFRFATIAHQSVESSAHAERAIRSRRLIASNSACTFASLAKYTYTSRPPPCGVSHATLHAGISAASAPRSAARSMMNSPTFSVVSTPSSSRPRTTGMA